MNQCLRCRKPCEASSVFCDACRALLRTQLWQEADTRSEAAFSTVPAVAMSPEDEQEPQWVNSNSDPLERITSPHPIVRPEMAPTPQTPQPVAPYAPHTPYENIVEQAVSRLNEAAQRIEQVEQAQHGSRRSFRAPRASRLAPLPDISAEICRESTPMPSVLQPQQSVSVGDLEDLGQRMPDLWPWLQDNDQEENENDNWANHTDPLMARQFPNSAEIARIEEEDMQRALAEGAVTMPLLPGSKKKRTHHIRLVFAVLATLALIALIADSSLITFVLLHSHRGAPVVNGVPTLTLSSNEASVGQTIQLHINQFSPNTHVFITHDIEIPVQLTSGSAIVNAGASGSTSVSMVVDNSWGPGFHTIDAEDSLTRYTASATLQIGGSGPTPPSHLVLSTNSIDLGPDIVGANTLQQLKLQNSGGGSISWSASTNQPWLLLSPTAGAFSKGQTIEIAGERANLKPGDYQGIITISSNVGVAQRIQISMTVWALPANASVLQVTPALLSFTALDGGANPTAQLLMISNPGSQPLHWSVASNTSFMLASQLLLMQSQDASTAWLSTNLTSGTVVPHGTVYIQVYAQSHNLLQGVYTDTLVFNGNGSADKTQSVSATLTVQPNCGLVLSTGYMSFTGVSGQGNPSNASLSLSATPSCSGTVNWSAVSYASWLTSTPASGQLQGNNRTVTAVSVNMTNLKPGTYTSSIAFSSNQSTQTLMVQLIVQPPPSPTTPIMAASPLNLSFSTTQGMPNPPGQVVTISNTGGGTLFWNTQVQGLASTWLWATPHGGQITPNQTASLTIGVDTSTLTPNTYVGQVILSGLDSKGNVASGSPQTIMVTLVVLPACTLAQPSSSSLAFSAIAGGTNPAPQTETITVSGNCAWPVTWQAKAVGRPGWLTLSPTSGVLTASGQSATLTVSANIAGLASGNYYATVALSAIDSSNVPAQGSPQNFAVALTVLPPCTLQLSNTNFAFSVGQGQPSPPAQTLSFSESGSCARPVNWTATGDPNSSAWLSLSATSGSDNGSGASISVGVSSTTMNPGTYTGSITLTATDSNGVPVQGSPQTITVTVTITGYTISGTVMACTSNPCSNPSPLAGATLTLTANGSSTKFGTAVSDSSGNYVFNNNNIPLGSYTITASGSNGSTNYTGSASVNVTGNMTNVIVDVYPG